MLLCALSLILGGVLASASFIIRNKPDARRYIDRLVPFQTVIGVVLVVVGVIFLLNILLSALRAPVLSLLTALLCLALGFLLAYHPISTTLLRRNPTASAQGARVREKLIAWQTPLGLAAIVIGLWALLRVIT